MPRVIKEAFQFTATNADILAAPSRLAAIPRNGLLVVEVSTTDCDGTNFGQLTIQMPDGDIPLEDVIIPANGFSVGDNILHEDTKLMVSLAATQGGHVGVAYTENGAVAAAYFMFTLTFP